MNLEKFFKTLEGIEKLRLHGWIDLQIKKEEMSQCGDIKLVDLIIDFIKLGTSFKQEELETLPWFIIGEAFQFIDLLNVPSKDFPFLKPSKETKSEIKNNWDYPGRIWFIWFSTFAENYGWSEKIVENLEIDTACGLMQEIMINEQMEKEFFHSLSEIAYPYDNNSKKSRYKPLPRPEWMLPVFEEKIIRYPKKYHPIGEVIKLDLENENKNIKSSRGV